MTLSAVDIRVRRPRNKEVLIQTLRADAGFPTMRDVLLFAAALGFRYERRKPFEESGEPIRWDTLIDPAYAQTLVSMIAAAAAAATEDPEILAADRQDERIRIFEEYANGGLEFLQGEISRRKEPADQVCASLVSDCLLEAAGHPKPILESLVDELSWE